MIYTTVIFDFDFTLADASPAIIDSMNSAFRGLGLEERDGQAIIRTVGLTLTQAFGILTGLDDAELAKRFLTLFKERADQIMTAQTELLPGAVDVLTRLKNAGCNTAIVTSKLRYRIEETLQKHGITSLVDYIVGFDDVQEAKPSPEGLLKALAHFCVDKRNTLYVGDSYIDANAAANAGVDFAAVTTGTTSGKDFQALPHVWIVKGLSELLCYI